MIILTKNISEHQLDWRNDPAIYAWTRQNGLLSSSDHEKWLEKIKSDPSIEMMSIYSKLKWTDVGTCGLTSLSPVHGTAEFSLFIAPEFQGQGYGRGALQELVRHGFKNRRLHLIWGETFVDNPAYHLFNKLGFKTEGRLRERYFKNGQYKDTFILSITENEAKEESWY